MPNDLPTLKLQIANYLKTHGKVSIQSIAQQFGRQRQTVKEKLYGLKRDGLVQDELIHEQNPLGYKILVHRFWLTPEGIRWLESVRKS